MTEILSYGGGIQTIAMCVLVATGRLPKPDFVIAADTGREMPSTWQYAREHAAPLLARVGLDLHIAPHDLATVDLYAHNGQLLMPMFTPTGKLFTYCSSEWKAAVLRRYARRVLGVEGRIINWIGFSLDEKRRVKSEEDRRYPLLDLMLTRTDCQSIIAAAGLPQPSKSRCYMCPHQSTQQWREVRDNYPELWQNAVEIERELSDANEFRTGKGYVFLHKQRVPLADVDLSDESSEPSRQCGLGLCYV